MAESNSLTSRLFCLPIQDSADMHDNVHADESKAKREIEDFKLEAFKHMSAPGHGAPATK